MKTSLRILVVTAVCSFGLGADSLFAQGTAFTYQGRLTDGSGPANGVYDLQFNLYDMASGGGNLGTNFVDDVSITNGLFTVSLDFGPGVFDGSRRFLEIGVRPGASVGAYTSVVPRQMITASPYAILAGNISGTLGSGQLADGAVTTPKLADGAVGTTKLLDGSVTAAKLGAPSVGTGALSNGAVTSVKIAPAAVGSSQLAADSVSGPKIADGSITAADVDATAFATTFWKVNGNAGTTAGTHFLGTTDSQPLEFKVNNARALRLELNGGAPTLVGGFSGNSSGGFVGGTIAGGGTSGATNKLGGNWATVGGGYDNQAMGFYATVAGGRENLATNFYALVAGGFQNTADGPGATVGGGQRNASSGEGATVGGGTYNTTIGLSATVSGGSSNTSSSDFATVGGGNRNTSSGRWATVGGGGFNTSSDLFTTVGGGWRNNIATNARASTIAGGEANAIGTNAQHSLIAGGYGNDIASSLASTIAGGENNGIGMNADASAIGGGIGNNIADNSTSGAIGGGQQNTITANAQYATIPGGFFNTANGNSSFAAGHRAKANHDGSFVWADDHNFDFASTAANKVRFRCTSGFDIITGIDGAGNQTAGVYLSPADSSWNVISDRNTKKNFQPVDAVAVLDKLAAVPITQWNYKWESDTNTAHLGPMAQDFKAAFFPGRDDKSISTLEFDGVELAAIQGLNQKVEELKGELKRRDRENAELRQRLESLEKAICRQGN